MRQLTFGAALAAINTLIGADGHGFTITMSDATGVRIAKCR
jgi:hypothetical protein